VPPKLRLEDEQLVQAGAHNEGPIDASLRGPKASTILVAVESHSLLGASLRWHSQASVCGELNYIGSPNHERAVPRTSSILHPWDSRAGTNTNHGTGWDGGKKHVLDSPLGATTRRRSFLKSNHEASHSRHRKAPSPTVVLQSGQTSRRVGRPPTSNPSRRLLRACTTKKTDPRRSRSVSWWRTHRKQMSGLDPNFWGPPLWKSMHSIAEGYPEQDPTEEHKQAARHFYGSLRVLLPCSSCCKHCCAHQQNDPVDDHLESRDNLARWVFDFHNRVNQRTGKPEWGWDQYVKTYRSGETQCGVYASDSHDQQQHKKRRGGRTIFLWTLLITIVAAIVVLWKFVH